MKAQKAMSVLATLSILSFTVACNSSDDKKNDRYDEGFAKGRAAGYEEGYLDGDADGYERAEAYFKTADYSDGYADGKTEGISIGYNQGYTVGKGEGYSQGYNVGKVDGFSDGYDDGEIDGFEAGWEVGYDDGLDASTIAAYEAGWEAGWDVGFDDGLNFYLSVGNTPKLKGYADVLSAFHNDLIDYTKISSPVQTRRGLVANGNLLFSETSITNKDTLKKAAVVEQYLVVEMSKQVKNKFGLSAERSLKIAKAANHFRKYATTRALTAEDTNAYANEIIGADFKAIEKAYQGSMKGNLSDLNSILEKAADKNGVSPEKMGQIVSKMFL